MLEYKGTVSGLTGRLTSRRDLNMICRTLGARACSFARVEARINYKRASPSKIRKVWNGVPRCSLGLVKQCSILATLNACFGVNALCSPPMQSNTASSHIHAHDVNHPLKCYDLRCETSWPMLRMFWWYCCCHFTSVIRVTLSFGKWQQTWTNIFRCPNFVRSQNTKVVNILLLALGISSCTNQLMQHFAMDIIFTVWVSFATLRSDES